MTLFDCETSILFSKNLHEALMCGSYLKVMLDNLGEALFQENSQ